MSGLRVLCQHSCAASSSASSSSLEGLTVPVRTGWELWAAPVFTDIFHQLQGQKLSKWTYTFHRLIFILCYFECINTQGEDEFLNTLLPAHSPAPDLDTFSTFWTAACCPSAPLLIFLWWKRFVVTALFGCHSPSRHYCEVLCLPTPHPRSGFLCCETSPSERIPCNRSSAVSAFLWVSAVQSSQI